MVEKAGGTDFPVGSRVMFFGAYGAFEDGTYSEWVAVRKEDLCLIPDNIDDVSAAGIPVAYLTAQVALTRAGFRAGKSVPDHLRMSNPVAPKLVSLQQSIEDAFRSASP